jgi:chemotaxis protein CheC
MSENELNFDDKLMSMLHIIANEGINNAARGFSGLLGEKLTVNNPGVRMVELKEIPHILGGPENEAIGVYLRAEGDISGQIMLVIPYEKALELVDLLIGNPPNTTQELGSYERSALAEVGNQTGTFFINSLSSLTGLDVRPSPPAVMVDMVGAILDIIVATTGGVSEHVLLMEANFELGNRKVETNFWVIPDEKTLNAIRFGAS